MLLNSNLHVNYMFFNSNKPNGKEIHMAITIAVANQKGGVGKTTSTIELAACLKEQGYNVLAVDLDQQSNLTRYISANPKEKGIYNVLKEEISATDAIQHTDEFDILSCFLHLILMRPLLPLIGSRTSISGLASYISSNIISSSSFRPIQC